MRSERSKQKSLCEVLETLVLLEDYLVLQTIQNQNRGKLVPSCCAEILEFAPL